VYHDLSDVDLLRHAREASARAVTLDERNAESQTAYAALLFRYDWRWAEAEQHFRRAIELNPRLAEAHSVYSRFLRSMGRFDEARAELDTIHALAPSPRGEFLGRARISYFAHEYSRGIRETVSGADTAARTYGPWTAQLYIAAGDYKAAEALLNRGPRFDNAAVRAHLYAVSGRQGAARALLDSIATSSEFNPVEIAGAYLAAGYARTGGATARRVHRRS
jgi:tetratricopeptide (TPR) repeat protein